MHPDPVVVAVYSAAPAHAPSFRVRALLLRRELARCGVALDAQPFFPGVGGDDRAIPWRLVGARRAFSSRLLRPGPPVGVAMVQRQVDYAPTLSLERTVTRGRRLVYDVDDAIWAGDTSSGAHAMAWLKRSRQKARWLAERADHVVAGNAILADWLRQYAARVTVIPSLVDVRTIRPRTHREMDDVVLGWIGSRTTARYLERLEQPLADVRRRVRGRVTLVVVGGTLSRRVPGVHYEVIPWSEANEREALRRMDIGVMPLVDTEWTRGKCAYKALQYMAAGVPVVADPVGITEAAVGAGGAMASGPEEWAEAIVRLASDADRRALVGAAGRARVCAEFSVERWVPALASILRGGDV